MAAKGGIFPGAPQRSCAAARAAGGPWPHGGMRGPGSAHASAAVLPGSALQDRMLPAFNGRMLS